MLAVLHEPPVLQHVAFALLSVGSNSCTFIHEHGQELSVARHGQQLHDALALPAYSAACLNVELHNELKW